MNTFTGIFFHVNAGKMTVCSFTIFQFNGYMSIGTDWSFVLCNLVSFWKIGVEIIFACELIFVSNVGINRQAKFHRKLNCSLIYAGQCSGMSEINHTYISVW